MSPNVLQTELCNQQLMLASGHINKATTVTDGVCSVTLHCQLPSDTHTSWKACEGVPQKDSCKMKM